jgi:PHD/YefM family antitoxin component YafN of YafNO toxin-antitoxin module
MKTFNIAKAKHYLDTSMVKYLHEPITVTDQQKEIAVILSPEDFYQLLKSAKQSINNLEPRRSV